MNQFDREALYIVQFFDGIKPIYQTSLQRQMNRVGGVAVS